jgi:hypothetical protein
MFPAGKLGNALIHRLSAVAATNAYYSANVAASSPKPVLQAISCLRVLKSILLCAYRSTLISSHAHADAFDIMSLNWRRKDW